MVAADLLDWARRVRADFDRLSADLVDLDADPTVKLVQVGGLAGSSAAPARAAAEALERLWSLLPSVRSQLDQVDEEAGKGRKADDARVRHLLNDPIISLDTATVPASLRVATGAAGRAGALTVADAMNLMVADYAVAADVVGRIGAAWREGLPLVDSARFQIDALVADIGPFPEADAARAAVEAATAAAATDPLQLGSLLPPLRAALDAAERAQATLQARRSGLRAELDAAAEQLALIDRTVRDGAVALDAARQKIADPQGLLAPLDPVSVLDAPPRGLRPWLERVGAMAHADWRAAVNGLVAWRAMADGVEASAVQILSANSAPVTRRNELRGLLGGLAAKAGAAGRAEDPNLSRLHRAARDLLSVAPCDLPAAAQAVDAFRAAVNRQEDKR
ncbi:MAG: hypothetical protein IT196_21295 [Acidimicrobiales bacterium]|nr:hypothetical protein [Acidimicrobiales bacterium]